MRLPASCGLTPQDRRPRPASADRLADWTGPFPALAPGTTVEWNCIKDQETNSPETADGWELGANTVFSTRHRGTVHDRRIVLRCAGRSRVCGFRR